MTIEKNEEIIYNAIKRFLNIRKIRVYQIFSDRKILKELIFYLKEKEKIRYIDIRNVLEIKRGTMEGLKIYQKRKK